MKVLITGGAGFIGSHLVDRLVEEGHSVVIVDHHKKTKHRFPNTQATVYKIGFGEAQISEVLIEEKPDAICHLAAQISVTKSVADPAHDARVNILDSITLLDAARKAGVQHFVFASSGGAIYGDHPERPTPELMDAQPLSPYGMSKQAFERYLNQYCERHGMRHVVLRFANAYGPRQLPGGEAAVIPIFLRELMMGGQARIFGDGSSTRDFVYIDDITEAFLRALKSDYRGTINIASGQETSVMTLLNTLKEIHGATHEHVHDEDRAGEIKRSVLDPSLAKETLGWESRTGLRDGLKKTYDWFKNHLNEKGNAAH
jgi:UDP-glucose 4-epimerase